MPRIIDVPSDILASALDAYPPGDPSGWVIKRERVADARRASDLMRLVRAEADALLCEARRSAREDREAGFRQGVQAGVRAALVPLLTLLGQLQSLKQEVRDEAERGVRNAVESLLGSAPLLTVLLDTILETHVPRAPSTLRICVPPHIDGDALKAHCAGLGLAAHIETAKEGELFAAGWEGHLWEVHPEGLRERSHVNASARLEAISDECARAMCREALLAEAERLA